MLREEASLNVADEFDLVDAHEAHIKVGIGAVESVPGVNLQEQTIVNALWWSGGSGLGGDLVVWLRSNKACTSSDGYGASFEPLALMFCSRAESKAW